jgi:hypothetical protein
MGGMTTPDRYYDAALVCITLICDRCRATLDPDTDLGPNVSFKSDRYYILLGDEAYRRGWLIDVEGNATCPACAAKPLPNS